MIVTPADILTFIFNGSATAAQQVSINQIHPMVEGWVVDFLGYNPEQATRTEYLTGGGGQSSNGGVDVIGGRVVAGGGRGRQRLQLRHVPIRSVTSVYEDSAAYFGQAPNAFPAATLLTPGVDYFIDMDESGISRTGFLIKPSGWCTAPGSIKVTHVAGYSLNELLGGPEAAINAADLRLGVLYGIQDEYANRGEQSSQIASESVGNTSYTYANVETKAELSPRAKKRLARFLNLGWRAAG